MVSSLSDTSSVEPSRLIATPLLKDLTPVLSMTRLTTPRKLSPRNGVTAPPTLPSDRAMPLTTAQDAHAVQRIAQHHTSGGQCDDASSVVCDVGHVSALHHHASRTPRDDSAHAADAVVAIACCTSPRL
jgi:hypothetical protein